MPEWSDKRTFTEEGLVDLTHVSQHRLRFESKVPILHHAQYVALNLQVQSRHLEKRHEVVHEFPGRNLRQEEIASVLDAYVCQLCKELIRIGRGGSKGE